MGTRSSTKDKQMRQRLAQEAARLMAEEGVRDYFTAKKKAAERLGAPNTRNMPRNSEIEEALQFHQRLFLGEQQPRHLEALREAAVQAMRFFQPFEPRLTGSVLSGTAGQHSDVNLHLFADTAEEITVFLLDAGIPFEEGHRRFRVSRDSFEDTPFVRFLAGDHTIDALILPPKALRQAPPSPIDGKPMARANLNQVLALLQKQEEPVLDGLR